MSEAGQRVAGVSRLLEGVLRALQGVRAGLREHRKALLTAGVAAALCLTLGMYYLQGSPRPVMLQDFVRHQYSRGQYDGNTRTGGRYLVPNIVHFIWFGKDRTLIFLNYVSMRSAWEKQRPDVIYLHCDYLPTGKYWDRLYKEVPFTIKYMKPPKEVFGQPIADYHRHHQGDVAKIQILMKYGGIYLDYDVIVLRSMDELRQYPMTMGKERPPKLIAGMIIASKDSVFLKKWYLSYKGNYRDEDWDYNCAREAYRLSQAYPRLIHVEKRRYDIPATIDWSDLFLVHLMAHLNDDHILECNEQNIRTMNSTLGEVLRFIYYGSKKPVYVPRKAPMSRETQIDVVKKMTEHLRKLMPGAPFQDALKVRLKPNNRQKTTLKPVTSINKNVNKSLKKERKRTFVTTTTVAKTKTMKVTRKPYNKKRRRNVTKKPF